MVLGAHNTGTATTEAFNIVRNINAVGASLSHFLPPKKPETFVFFKDNVIFHSPYFFLSKYTVSSQAILILMLIFKQEF